MELKHFVLLLCIWSIAGFPSRPLNDRPSELAWQAWLLVDSQNNPSDPDRRITPKSVFIAPKLGQNNGSLPDCADGYRSDPMGRCIKFVKVDEAAHLDFLLERLNAMYATKPSGEGGSDDEVRPTTGPLQVNIPLGGGSGGGGTGFQSAEETEPDPEIAIIVAPTNGNFDVVEDTEAKFNVKRTHVTGDSSNEATDGKVDVMAADQQQQPETTTPRQAEETTTTEETVTEEETTTLEVPTTTDNLQALFFLVPMNESSHVPSNRTVVVAVAATGDTPQSQQAAEDADQADTATPTSNSTPIDINTEPEALQVKGKPDPQSELVADGPLASFVDPIHVDEYQAPNYVRFPSAPLSAVRFPAQFHGHDQLEASVPTSTLVKPQDPHRLTSGEIQELFRQYIQQNPEVVALTSLEKYPVRRRPVSEAAYTDGEDVVLQPQVPRPQYYLPTSFNHRNRDRNSEFWRPSATWPEDDQQKPLVLRFGHRYPPSDSGSSSRFSSERPGADGHHRYYEEQQQQQDYSNSFGRTRRRGILR